MSPVESSRQRMVRAGPAPSWALALTWALCMASLADAPAHAQPGPQVAPARQAARRLAPRPLETDPDQRRAIRGCPPGEDCRGQALEGLREFELEAFGPPPGTPSNPWVDDLDVQLDTGAARPRESRGAGRVPGRPARPTDLRPDLPWLAELDMPDLPVHWHERVIQYLEFYKNDPRGRNIMRGWLRAQAPYRDMIVSRLRRAGLPEDLLYVAMIESSYNPRTRSSVGAMGLWQFMTAGGRIYGLWIDRWIDERQDPVRSTDAVVLYWKDLYHRFGDWNLAMAAYNAGYGAVLRSVTRFNTNDFWELAEYENALPWGTVLYVPKALAAAIVGRNRALFGFDDIDAAPPMAWDEVAVPQSVSLRTVARAAGVSVESIEELNPQLRRNRTPPTIQGYVLRVPRGTGALFAVRFGQLRKDWDRYDTYVMAHGERFEDVATIHGIARRKLAELNGVEQESDVRGGTVLVVPRISAEEKRKNRARAEEELYTSGDPPAAPGEPLLVAVPDAELQLPGKRRVFYRVVAGDTSSGVAAAFGIAREDLDLWNDLDLGAGLHPRMILQVFVPAGWDGVATDGAPIAVLDQERLLVITRGSEQHIALMEERMGRERMVYTAEKRESFADIGRKFGLTDHDIARINRRPHDTVLQPGEQVVVYKVVDRSRSQRAEDQARARRRSESRRKRSDDKETRTSEDREDAGKAKSDKRANEDREAKGDKDAGEAKGDKDAREAEGDKDAGEAKGDKDAGEAKGDKDGGEAKGDKDAGERENGDGASGRAGAR
jgi:membrane-bound lytic murein transglycosylase D